MNPLVFVLVLWPLLFISIKYFDHVLHGTISDFLSDHSVQLHPYYITFSTQSLNAPLERTARRHRSFLTKWFALGVVLGFSGLVLSVVALTANILYVIPFGVDASATLSAPKSHTPSLYPKPHNARPSIHYQGTAEAFASASVNDTTPRKPPFSVKRRLAAAIDDSAAHSLAERYANAESAVAGAGGPLPPDDASGKSIRPSSPPQPARLARVPKRMSPILTPLVPGVTIPLTDTVYIVVAMLISAVVHELGHALAASMQDAKIDSVGGALAVLLPGAFVRLTGVEALTPFSQLKVWCAGAWHNFVLAAACLLAVSVLPEVLVAGYAHGGGALVVAQSDHSPLSANLRTGDVITGLGRFDVGDGGDSYRGALAKLGETGDSAGFCMSEKYFLANAHAASECCDFGNPRLQCLHVSDGVHKEPKRSCMPPRAVSSQPTCRLHSDCERAELAKCFLPVFPMGQKLIDVRVRSGRTGRVVHFFYQGYASVLRQSISVSSYVPRFTWLLPVAVAEWVAKTDLPSIAERQLQYLASISLALAILNMAPVFWLDGEASVSLFLKLLVPRIGSFHLTRITNWMLNFGTGVLMCNILLAVIGV